MAREDKDRVERLKRRLYARDAKTETGEERTALSSSPPRTAVSWDGVKPPSEAQPDTPSIPESISFVPKEEKTEEKEAPVFSVENPMAHRSTFASKFLVASFVFFVLATGAAAYMFFGGINIISPRNIDMEIVVPSLVDGGKEATLQVLIRNRNQTALEAADLIIHYPPGSRSPNNLSQELTYERHTIGDIGPGEQVKRTISAVFYGSEGVEQEIKMKLEYNVQGSNAIFERSADARFTIGSSPISLNITHPSERTTGESFEIEVEVRSNATAPLSHIVVQAQYPFGFSVLGTSPQAQAGGTFFRLGDFAPGESKKIRITGAIEGQDGDERVFRFLAGSVPDDTKTAIDVPFLMTPSTLTVREPFISGTISVGGKSGKTISAPPGQTLSGTIAWRNNLSEPISNVELSLAFSGPALEENSINATNGFYQSANSSIIWTREQEPSLASSQPGSGGSVQFTFATKSPGASGVLITNPVIDLTLNVRGVRSSSGSGKPENISSVASTRVTLISTPTVEAHAAHFTGPFANSGPMPPRAEQETTYTVIWTVKNPSNAIANTSVTTTLPPYVRFVSSQVGAGIIYNEGSRTVTWNVGELKAGAGYILSAQQAAFQIALLPSTSQVGSAPQLTGESVLSGQDRFAQTTVSGSAPPVTTNLSGESGFSSGMDIVGPK